MREDAMRKLFTLCAALLVATPAFAEDSIGAFYGHTMEVIGPTGAPHYFHYNPNYTFTEQVNGHVYSGGWRLHGSNICLNYDPPLNTALPGGRRVLIAANKVVDPKVEDTTPRPLLIHIIR
jgi:hypothetical protein